MKRASCVGAVAAVGLMSAGAILIFKLFKASDIVKLKNDGEFLFKNLDSQFKFNVCL
jgi:hypothetical protein